MADYAPLYMPGDVITGVASGAIVGGKAVMVNGNGTISTATADSNAVVGIAAFDAASGTNVTYHARGQVHVSVAAGAITAAARLNSAASGNVASATAGVGNIGIALTTAADTALVTWMEC
ncbi:capsid cement protein [Micromonospora sp. CA-248212]|uniref:capsid cement protein n=1 Tax=Micromonospora sp. CA-248212 TaxID=3239961 RepID=UPI003D925672